MVINESVKFDYSDEQIESYKITYKYNDIMFSLCLLRIYFVFRFFLTISKYKTSRSARVCRLYGEKSDYQFSIVSLFNDKPFPFLSISLILLHILFALEIRIFEAYIFLCKLLKKNRPVRTWRNDKADITGKKDFTNIINSLWCSFITFMGSNLKII